MKDSIKIAIGIFLGVALVLSCLACASLTVSAGGLAFLSSLLASGRSEAGSHITGPLSSDAATSEPLPLGSLVVDGGFQIAVTAYEFSGSYASDYGYEEAPPEGAQYLWVFITVENIGSNAEYSASSSEFSVLYEGQQTSADTFSPDRRGYPLFEGGELFPGVRREGWIRFTIPAAAEPKKLTIAYAPFALFGREYHLWMLSP